MPNQLERAPMPASHQAYINTNLVLEYMLHHIIIEDWIPSLVTPLSAVVSFRYLQYKI